MKREEDPGIAWIRDVRHKISVEFEHDPKKLGDHLRELEKKYAERLEPVSKPHFDVTNKAVLEK